MKNYCYTCMNEIPGSNICPHCMHENTADEVIYRLKPGTILNKKFLVGNCLGEGGFGITYIGRDLTLDRKVAIKEYFPNGYVNRNNDVDQLVTATTEQQISFFKKGLSSFLDEARKIARLNDVPGIVDVREYFEENSTAYIIMEYLDGVNLSKYLKENGPLIPETVFKLTLPITYSLQKMHDAGIIHRDISPDNIMYLQDGTLKLTDFGSARFFTNSQKEMSVMLKQGYAPEEQYSKTGDQGPWTDVYGLCATMYKCITGKVPVDAIDRIKNDTLLPPSELGVEISEPMQIALMYGLAVFKHDRCKSMQELSYIMEKALANQNIHVESANYYNRINQTMIADEETANQTMFANDVTMYREEFNHVTSTPNQKINYRVSQPTPNRNPDPLSTNSNPSNGDNYTYANSYNTAYEKQRNSKTPIIIAATIFLCVALIAGTVIFLFLQYEKELDSKSSSNETAETQTAYIEEDKDEEISPQLTPAQESQTEPEEATEPPAEKVSFSAANASHILKEQKGLDGQIKNYKPENVLSKDGTCWCPKEGSGVDEWIKLDLPYSAAISGLDIINGYAGDETQYNNNAKPTSIRIEFSDGTSITKSLAVYSASNRKDIQRITFNPVNTKYVKITILSIEGGKEYNDTCITYIAPYNP